MADRNTNISNNQPTQIGSSSTLPPSENLEQELANSAEITKKELNEDPKLAQTLGATPALQTEVVDIEKELLDTIIKRLDQNSMSEEDAEQLAADFLDLLPVTDQSDLLKKLQMLSEENPAAKGIYIEYNKPYEEDATKRKLELMSQHLHQGKIEEALAIAKGGKNA
jgi:hypothetical protein